MRPTRMLKMKLRNMLRSITQPWRSTGTNTDESDTSGLTFQQAIRSSATFHNSVYKLPLETYIEVITTEDLRPLIITGEPNDLELQDAFENIVTEFSCILKTDKTDAIIKISKRIGLLQWQIIYVDNILIHLEKRFDYNKQTVPELCTELRRMGYNFDLDPTNEYKYRRELGFVRTRAKTLLQQRRDLLAEYARMTNSQGGNGPKRKTREMFENELINLGRFQGYHIDPKTTMTSSYAAMIGQYNIAYKQAEEAKTKTATNGRR